MDKNRELGMHSLDKYHYDLPDAFIAQTPLSNRDSSKLMIINRFNNTIEHASFHELTNYLTPNDVLVFNNTKVIKSRLVAWKNTGAKLELFLLNPINETTWTALIRNSKRVNEHDVLTLGNGDPIRLIKKINKEWVIRIESSTPVFELLESHGSTPLPPYIKQSNPNLMSDNYQTIYAKNPGAIAAPTAGLHFTTDTFSKLSEKSIDTIYITLHVGLGTFNPIQSNNIQDHIMHSENYTISNHSETALNRALDAGKRIIAIGTTVCRALESNIKNGRFRSGEFQTSLYITPGYSFNAVNGLVTNFHLPKSSLLILVSAFYTRERILNAYNTAISNQYRFFSFGDAMLII